LGHECLVAIDMDKFSDLGVVVVDFGLVAHHLHLFHVLVLSKHLG